MYNEMLYRGVKHCHHLLCSKISAPSTFDLDNQIINWFSLIDRAGKTSKSAGQVVLQDWSGERLFENAATMCLNIIQILKMEFVVKMFICIKI